MAEEIITGLDIGSSKIRVVVGQAIPGEDGKPRLHITGAVEVPSEGVHKGSISSMDDAVSSISKALERAERMTTTRTVVTDYSYDKLSRLTSTALASTSMEQA
ncbi:hypothetical protein IH979_00710, partial [Patescibacteria group bacterium]|nr:hypothetical protein [Patescibacteria group bacterium]